VVSEFFEETKGNPFFVEELFRHLAEENRLYDAEGTFRAEIKIAELEVPQSVRLVVWRRLARLSESAQRILRPRP
jgi:predicted ATPase